MTNIPTELCFGYLGMAFWLELTGAVVCPKFNSSFDETTINVNSTCLTFFAVSSLGVLWHIALLKKTRLPSKRILAQRNYFDS
mmetsp:Transcript_33463/g.77176  ORF Transcript_33463/g.77176 Transcript_33463/m.77176 type:complete len:83 (-) Transcript_33463:1325-1573(-)